MTIAFQNTPVTRNPGFYFEVDPSRANTATRRSRALILAQAITAGLPQTPQIVSSASSAKAAFGQGSPIALMTAQYRARDVFGELWALPVASNGAGTAGTMVTTFTGPSTAAGTLTGYVCGIRVQALITAGMTPTQISTAFVAAANLIPNLPVTYAAAAAVATATAKVVGPLDLDVRFNYGGQPAGEAFPAGVGATSVISLGTGAPDLTTALANLADEPFDMIMVSYSDAVTLDAIKNFLSDATGRWLPTRLLFGHGFAAMRGTLGTVTAALTASNDQHMTIMPFNDSPTPSWLWAADLVGSIANSLRTDPGLPVQQLAMGVLAPPVQSRFVFSDRDVLLYDGGSTFVVDDDGTVRTSRVITTYQRNTFGIPDDAFLDVETPFQLAEIISFYRGDYSSSYARKKIVSDGTRLGTSNRDTVTPAILSTHALALYRQLEVQGKVQDSTTFKKLLVTEYIGGGRVNQLLPITLADQLRIIAASVQFTK